MHTVFIEFREKFLDIKQNSRLYRTDYYPSLQVLDNLFSDPQVISCFQNNAVPARCLNTTYKILNIIQQDDFRSFYSLYNKLTWFYDYKIHILDNFYFKSWSLLKTMNNYPESYFLFISGVHSDYIEKLYCAMNLFVEKFEKLTNNFCSVLFNVPPDFWHNFVVAVCSLYGSSYFIDLSDNDISERFEFIRECINKGIEPEVVVKTITRIHTLSAINFHKEKQIIYAIQGDWTEFTEAFCDFYRQCPRQVAPENLKKTLELLNTKNSAGNFEYKNVSQLLWQLKNGLSESSLIKLIQIDNRQIFIDCIESIKVEFKIDLNLFIAPIESNLNDSYLFTQILQKIKLIFAEKGARPNDWFVQHSTAIIFALSQNNLIALLGSLEWLLETKLTHAQKVLACNHFLNISDVRRVNLLSCCKYLMEHAVFKMQLFKCVDSLSDNVEDFERTIKCGWDIILNTDAPPQVKLIYQWLQCSIEERQTLLNYLNFVNSYGVINQKLLIFIFNFKNKLLDIKFIKKFDMMQEPDPIIRRLKNDTLDPEEFNSAVLSKYQMNLARCFENSIFIIPENLAFLKAGWNLITQLLVLHPEQLEYENKYYNNWIYFAQKSPELKNCLMSYINLFEQYNLLDLDLLSSVFNFENFSNELVVEELSSLEDAQKLKDFFLANVNQHKESKLLTILYTVKYPFLNILPFKDLRSILTSALKDDFIRALGVINTLDVGSRERLITFLKKLDNNSREKLVNKIFINLDKCQILALNLEQVPDFRDQKQFMSAFFAGFEFEGDTLSNFLNKEGMFAHNRVSPQLKAITSTSISNLFR